MPVKELPVLITPSIARDPDKLAKAVMRNFDHLIGESGYVENMINGGGFIERVEEIAAGVPSSSDSDVDEVLNEAGVGRPDGNPPTDAPTNILVTPGVNYDLWLVWDAVANNSAVNYVVERRVGVGGAWVEAGTTVAMPGGADGKWQFHDVGLVLNTDYYYRIKAKDPDGDGPYSAIVGPFQVNKLVGEQITDATINVATKVQGLLPQANLSTITDASKLADAIISTQATFDRIVSGAVVAGSHIVGGTIVSSKLYSGAVAADRIQATNIAANAITADHIGAGVITSDEIYAGAIDANRIQAQNIAANAITADKIQANAIDGKTITGANFWTGSTGQSRIGLGPSAGGTKDKIAFYNSGGTEIGRIFQAGNDITIGANGWLWFSKAIMQGDLDVNFNDITNVQTLYASAEVKGAQLITGQQVGAPPAGTAAIYFNPTGGAAGNGSLVAKKSNGDTVQVAAWP